MMTEMNGFEVVKEDDPWGTRRSLRYFKDFMTYDIDFSTITEGVIRDKSKGDGIGKTLVLLQASWFVAQCIDRAMRHLPVTRVEMATLGHTAFMSSIYVFWWNKPVDVRYPITLYATRRDERADAFGAEISGSGEAIGDMNIGESSSQGNLNSTEMHTLPLMRTSAELTIPLIPVEPSTELTLEHPGGQYTLPWRVRFGNHVPRVPQLYELESVGHWLAFIFLILTSGVFGAIHCLGWNSIYPPSPSSNFETYYWRAAAVAVTAVPVAAVSITGMMASTFRLKIYEVDVIVWPLLCLYMCARISLITLAFISLRHLPSGAYVVPTWIDYIPHL